MTLQEKIKHIRDITMSPYNKINIALEKMDEDVEKTIKLLIEEKQTDPTDMANRVTNAGIVYSYVHNHKVGAMIVLSCQTDFVARNDLFINLAKDICMHICSSPIAPVVIDKSEVSPLEITRISKEVTDANKNKPAHILDKIIVGKYDIYVSDYCLLNQKFVKDDKFTINQLIQSAASTLGEKITIKQFIKMKNDIGYVRLNSDDTANMNKGIRPEYTVTSLN